MQRLFSTFPNSWPGAALLLLRVTAAAPLLTGSVSALCGAPRPPFFGSEIIAFGLAALLIAGFFTPVAAGAEILLELWMMRAATEFSLAPTLLAVIGASLVMLGPGAWSVDARIFGRKRINLPKA